jgi:hypothetical protein
VARKCSVERDRDHTTPAEGEPGTQRADEAGRSDGGFSVVVVGAFAFVCAEIGIAIFENMHGWLKWALEFLWGVNVMAASRLALAYRPRRSNRARRRSLDDRRTVR